MKLIFADSDNKVKEVILCSQLEVDNNNIYWDNGYGSREGVQVPFIVLDDLVSVDIGDPIDLFIPLDKKGKFKKLDIEGQIADMQVAINFLLEI